MQIALDTTVAIGQVHAFGNVMCKVLVIGTHGVEVDIGNDLHLVC